MLPAQIKDLIDRQREDTGETISKIIENAIVNLLAFPATTSKGRPETQSSQHFKRLSANDMQQIAADLKRILDRFEQTGEEKHGVTSNPKPVTNDNAEESVKKEEASTREIYRLVRLLNNMEIGLDEIAFTLNKRNYKTLSGGNEWKAKDVQAVLKDISQKYGHINPLFSISFNP